MFAIAKGVPYNPASVTMKKDEKIGFRIPAELKRELSQIAKTEGRSLAQVCEVFLRAGASSYKKRGSAYMKSFLHRDDRG